jgi:hypothetical protein
MSVTGAKQTRDAERVALSGTVRCKRRNAMSGLRRDLATPLLRNLSAAYAVEHPMLRRGLPGRSVVVAGASRLQSLDAWQHASESMPCRGAEVYERCGAFLGERRAERSEHREAAERHAGFA